MVVKEISIIIDDIVVKTTLGKTVLEAAIDAGIYIPYLCYHPGMKPFAACRMCVVEVKDGRGYPASCTLPVSDGMVINNTSSSVHELRRNVMEMLLADHPNGCLTCHRVDLCGPEDICLRHVAVNDRCVTCPKNERCELKDTARFLGMSLESPLEYKYRNLPVETGDPFYDRDYNLCIVCGRCVRVCEEVRGDNAITFTERSGQALVGTSFGSSLLESGCEFCGACLDVCPVGALVESDHKWEKAVKVERTICPHCPVGCQVNLEVNRFGKIIRSLPEINSPANRGQGCFKGKFGLDFVNHKERLRVPLVRRNGELQETTWSEALDLVAEKFRNYIGSSFGLLASPNSTNEEGYLAQKFSRVVMGSNNVDYTSNVSPGAVEPLQELLGYGASSNSTWELENSRCILVFNSNMTEEHNVVSLPIKKAIKSGSKLIVIDPREIELAKHAHIWIRPKPGTELLVLGAILKEILIQGLERREWLEDNCEGIEQFRSELAAVDVDYVAEESGVPRDMIEKAVRVYAPSDPSAIVYALDNIDQNAQRDCVYALAALALLTGNIGRASTGIYPLSQGANHQGLRDMGCIPHMLPGYCSTSDKTNSRRFEELWGVSLPEEPGLDVDSILKSSANGDIKAMLVIGNSVNISNGRSGDGLAALGALEFLVVHDDFLTPSSMMADVVLPRVTFAEKSGTFTNLERRVQMVRQVIELQNSDARSEGWVICQLAQRMGHNGFEFSTEANIMDEISRVVSIYGGISHQRLEAESRLVIRPDISNPLPTQILYSDREYRGIQWPCVDSNSPGTPILYSNGFADQKVRLLIPRFEKTKVGTSQELPFIFTPGRVLIQHDRKMDIAKGQKNRIEKDEIIEINRDDASMLGIEEGSKVRLEGSGVETVGIASLRDDLQRGVISCTELFGQLMVNLESSNDPDPMSKVPGLEVVPARVSRMNI